MQWIHSAHITYLKISLFFLCRFSFSSYSAHYWTDHWVFFLIQYYLALTLPFSSCLRYTTKHLQLLNINVSSWDLCNELEQYTEDDNHVQILMCSFLNCQKSVSCRFYWQLSTLHFLVHTVNVRRVYIKLFTYVKLLFWKKKDELQVFLIFVIVQINII